MEISLANSLWLMILELAWAAWGVWGGWDSAWGATRAGWRAAGSGQAGRRAAHAPSAASAQAVGARRHACRAWPRCVQNRGQLLTVPSTLTATGCTPLRIALYTVPNPPEPSCQSDPFCRFKI